MALTFSNPRAVIDGETICALLPMPIRIGPTSNPFAFIFKMFRTPEAASVLAKKAVGRALDPGIGEDAVSERLIQRAVSVHLAFVFKVARLVVQDL